MKIKIKKVVVAEETEVLNELDFVAGFKNFLKSPVATSKNIAKGIAQIGITGKETTILGGEEIFDIEKRNQVRKQAEGELDTVLQTLDDAAKTDAFTRLKSELENVSFPNQANEESFNSYISKLKGLYDGVVKAHEEGKVTTELANAVIAALRDVVIYYQDYKIADKYIYLNEAEEGAVSKSYAAAYSKKLPLGLAAAGLTMTGLGFAADSDLFKEILSKLKDVDTVDVNKIKQAIKGTLQIKPGEGPTQLATRVLGLPKDFLGANAPAEHLADPRVQEFFTKTLSQVLRDPSAGGPELLNQITSNPTAYGKNVAEVFAKLAKGTETAKLDPTTIGAKKLMIDPGKFDVVVGEKVTEISRNVPADTLKNKFLNFLGNKAGAILQGLGLALVGGAAVSGAMRFKGKRSSRMATLKALVDSFKNVVAAAKQLSGKEELPSLAGDEERPQLPASQTSPALTGKPEQPALTGKAAQSALPTQPRLALPPGEQPGEKQGPERVIPVGPSSIEGKSVEALLSKLKSDLDSNEQLNKLSSENERLGKAVKTMVQIAINDITKQLEDAGYESGDEVTIAEAKTISISFFDKFAKDLTAKARKTGGASTGMQTILAVVRNWAEGAGFSVDPSALEKFGKKDTGAFTKSDKGTEQPAAKADATTAAQAPEEKNVVDPENIAVAKTPVDAGKATKVGTSLKKALGNKVTVKTSKAPKGKVAITEPPLNNAQTKAAKRSAKKVGADPTKISATDKSAIFAPSTPAGVKKVEKPEDAAAAINKLEKAKETSKEAPKRNPIYILIDNLSDLANDSPEVINDDQVDKIKKGLERMKIKSLENIEELVNDTIKGRDNKKVVMIDINGWFKEHGSSLKESFEFKNRFMKLAGLLKG
jgi:hypothetical protein